MYDTNPHQHRPGDFDFPKDSAPSPQSWERFDARSEDVQMERDARVYEASLAAMAGAMDRVFKR